MLSFIEAVPVTRRHKGATLVTTPPSPKLVSSIIFQILTPYSKHTTRTGADWYNYAASQGRQVVMNNRCGANQSDFVTPEYATFSSPLVS